jgi:hypothetical protein
VPIAYVVCADPIKLRAITYLQSTWNRARGASMDGLFSDT